jgi:hypothetical protein
VAVPLASDPARLAALAAKALPGPYRPDGKGRVVSRFGVVVADCNSEAGRLAAARTSEFLAAAANAAFGATGEGWDDC